MKITLDGSVIRAPRNGRRTPLVWLRIEPETAEEIAIMKMAASATRTVEVWDTGVAQIEFEMPRAKKR